MPAYEKIVEKYKAAVRFDPGAADAWCGRCFTLMVVERKEKAADEFKGGILS